MLTGLTNGLITVIYISRKEELKFYFRNPSNFFTVVKMLDKTASYSFMFILKEMNSFLIFIFLIFMK